MPATDLAQRFASARAWEVPGAHSLCLRYLGAGTRRLEAARDALWSFPGLEGCWRRNDRAPTPASRIASTYGLAVDRALYGVARIPGTPGVPCAARALPPDDGHAEHCPCCAAMGLYTTELDGWLELALPFGALRQALPIGRYPVDDGQDLAWRDDLDRWLREVAAHVHRAAPFDLGLIGWSAARMVPLPRRPEQVPAEREEGHLVPGEDGLVWFPPTLRGLIDPEDAEPLGFDESSASAAPMASA